MILFLVVMTYAAALLLDFRRYLRGSAKGEKALYLALMAASLVPMALSALELKVPSPTEPIIKAVQAIFGAP